MQEEREGERGGDEEEEEEEEELAVAAPAALVQYVEVSRGTWAGQGRAAQARTMQGSSGRAGPWRLATQPTAGLFDLPAALAEGTGAWATS